MSSIAVAKSSMGFTPAKSRPGCCNCIHVKRDYQDRMPPYDTASWTCKKGGFYVTAQAICKKHETKTPTTGSTQ